MTQSRKQLRADHCSIWSKRIYTKPYILSAEESFEGMFNAHGQDRKGKKKRDVQILEDLKKPGTPGSAAQNG